MRSPTIWGSKKTGCTSWGGISPAVLKNPGLLPAGRPSNPRAGELAHYRRHGNPQAKAVAPPQPKNPAPPPYQ